MKKHIENLLRQANEKLKNEGWDIPDDIPVIVERCKNPKHGDYTTNFPILLCKYWRDKYGKKDE